MLLVKQTDIDVVKYYSADFLLYFTLWNCVMLLILSFLVISNYMPALKPGFLDK